MAIKDFQNDVVTMDCNVCGNDIAYTIPKSYDPKFMEEFGEYENLVVSCPSCEEEGRSTIHIVNVNIPEHDEMELDVMEGIAPPEEVQSRRVVRNIMWAKRPDLRNKNRENDRKKYVSENASAIAQMKAAAREMNQGRGPQNEPKP